MGFASLRARRTAPARRISAHLSSGQFSANLARVSQQRISATVPRHLRHRAVLRRVCRIVEQDADAAPGDRVELGLEPERAEGREHKGWKPSKWTAVSGSARARVQPAPWLSDWRVPLSDQLSGAARAVGHCQALLRFAAKLSDQGSVCSGTRVLRLPCGLPRDHSRSPETTRDHPRSPESACCAYRVACTPTHARHLRRGTCARAPPPKRRRGPPRRRTRGRRPRL